MPNDLENALRQAADKIVQYVSDVAAMTVETRYVEVGADGASDFAQARPLARTELHVDGDSHAVLPMRRNAAGGFEVDAALLDLHQRNVTTAIEYRARIMNALLEALRSPAR